MNLINPSCMDYDSLSQVFLLAFSHENKKLKLIFSNFFS